MNETAWEFEDFDAVSATDCTGLFSRAPLNRYEYNSYMDIMTFSPADFRSEESFYKNPLDKRSRVLFDNLSH